MQNQSNCSITFDSQLKTALCYGNRVKPAPAVLSHHAHNLVVIRTGPNSVSVISRYCFTPTAKGKQVTYVNEIP